MTRRSLRPLMAALSLGTVLGACDISTGLDNHRPVIASVTVVPAVIHKADSTTVTLNASDPDGDVLVYDWITDGRLRIRDARLGSHALYATDTNAMVFYPDYVTTPPDTCWVQCIAKDRRGLSDTRTITFIVNP